MLTYSIIIIIIIIIDKTRRNIIWILARLHKIILAILKFGFFAVVSFFNKYFDWLLLFLVSNESEAERAGSLMPLEVENY
jgi:hypothetical protein